ncbi:MAG: hypothetical protein WAO19_10890 [Candidatus Kryptoniota bacterium]
MSTLNPQGYRERTEPVPPFKIHIVSYRLGEKFYCTVDNVDPGANIARAEAQTQDEAESKAIAKAKERLEYSASRIQKI